MDIEEFEVIEELVAWNLSFNIPIEETLKQVDKLEYLFLFINVE
jgi:hypothetical protein